MDDVLKKKLDSLNCGTFVHNLTLPPSSPLVSFHIKFKVTMFSCDLPLNKFPEYYKNTNCQGYNIYYLPDIERMSSLTEYTIFQGCSSIQLPYKSPSNLSDPFTLLTAEFPTEVKLSDECDVCIKRGGQCRMDRDAEFYCAKGYSTLVRMYIPAVSTATGVGILIMICCFFRRKLSSPKLSNFWKKKSQIHENIEAFLRDHGPVAIKRYSYSDIKKMTNYFKDELGQGGYGSVYKGTLCDGCPIAVKVLNESKGNGEEFINEVASISRTSHVNVVTLLGFCFEGSKRALVYEFMANGSLEKFIYEENPSSTNRELACDTLNKIAVGVAKGLEYLHRGCNTRILHLDIKPHNILLDEDFCPKISDFGLSKICPRKESIVSMLGARGTAGYIAPEVFSRNFGGVSHKSDVYSYGMMVLEMVGGRKNINVEADCTSEIYFPSWIYKRLELNEELALRNISMEGDEEMMRKMIIVGIWCIQTHPSNRPAIGEVVEMLEGSLESLHVPPKPFLSSPPRSPAQLGDMIIRVP
ncbi:Receptor-like protein kinase [Quillaja saponaria]|uniref:Receptor-like protein kinase n=1 Tax=Quillaja saponaria TaxID=32244 RepID=A0AAD7PGF0_QUISA|nr:Receptor-like protein kinase [Quillaja saponaria]